MSGTLFSGVFGPFKECSANRSIGVLECYTGQTRVKAWEAFVEASTGTGW